MDWLTHLPPAWGLHAILALVEIEASRLPLQSGELEQCFGFLLWCVHELLIADFVEVHGEGLGPVCHESLLCVYVVAYAVQARTESFVYGEVFAVDGNADIAWVTAAPNDFGVGEQCGRQPQVEEVQGRLVDKQTLARACTPADGSKVGVPGGQQ